MKENTGTSPTSITRRSFVGSMALGASALAMGGCSDAKVSHSPKDAATIAKSLSGGEWKTAACWQTCHCGCKNQAYVVDGVVVRQKTDDGHDDTLEMPQQRGCVKGRALRQFVMGPDRIKYPMKRKNWKPGGGGDVTLRGRDEWERISWDEAYDLIASELTRIKGEYGNSAFGSISLAPASLLAAYGGYTSFWGQQSKGAWPLVANVIKGGFFNSSNDRFSLLDAELVVLWGFNPIWGAGGSNAHYLRQAKDRGARVVVVDSWFSPTCQALGAEWVPCRPTTDGALLAAIAYYLIENDLCDKEFLDACCVGFDAEHMPEGEEGEENFKDYILGAYDGIPKTPEWASAICGTDPDTIRELAHAMGTIKPMTLKAGQAPGRTGNGDEFAHMFYTVGWMTGNVGKPGAEVSCADGSQGVMGGPEIVSQGWGSDNLVVGDPNVGCTGPRGDYMLEKGIYDPDQYYGIPGPVFWKSIKEGKHIDFERGERKVNIKCLFNIGVGAQFNQNNDQATAIEVLRTPGMIEFVVKSEIVMSPDAQYADIVLPACTRWEVAGGTVRQLNRETFVFADKLMEPLFESKSDLQMNIELAEKMGIDTSGFCLGNPDIDGYMCVAGSTITDPDTGELVPLVTVTQDDIDKYQLEMEPIEGKVPFEDVLANGGYQVARSKGDAFEYIAMRDFVADPGANPLPTKSGKLEIRSQALVDAFAVYNTTPVNAIAKYVPSVEGYEDARAQREAHGYEGATFQLITLHHVRQAHSSCAEVKSLSEIFANNVLLNDRDAVQLGVTEQDVVLLSNDHGKAYRRAQVTSRIMPGVVIIGQGNWTRLDDETGIDEGCNVNYLTGGHLAGQGQCQFNSVLVKIEKAEGVDLVKDYLRPNIEVM